MSRQKEDFVPVHKDWVGIYSCGPTVYRTASVGNYRATFTADLIRNTLKFFGYTVKSVMNITDVGHLVGDGDDGEDKLEKGAKRDGISAWDVAKKYEEIFVEGMKNLNIDPFDVMPRATEHIKEQIALVKILEEKGYTYSIDGDGIYMDTSKVEEYGKLMGPNYKKRLEDLHAGERVEMGGKKHPTDFALWKFSPVGEKRQMEWESPRGMGFPGWHIECSAMSSKYLGEQFDIHHGGADHITIHHPNEIAQSECAFGKHPWVKYWVHNEFLQVDGGKMSKSLGNVYNLTDLAAKGFSALDLKYFYFTAHYRSFQNFTWDNLQQAKNSRLSLVKKLQGHKVELVEFKYSDWYKEVEEALADDMNTPKLLAVIHKALAEPSEEVYALITYLDKILLKCGLFDGIEEEKVDIPQEVKDLAEQRLEAKKNKNYALADELRGKITALGWTVKDVKDGYEIVK